MPFKKLPIANRGEIAIRIARAAAEMGIQTVTIHSDDDAQSLHTRKSDETRAIGAVGVPAYLDGQRIVAIAKEAGCDAIHPGYGFLSENATFARLCLAEGLTFVGPRPETLELFGDKSKARAFAQRSKVPVPRGTYGPTSLDQVRDFLKSLGANGAIMIKAVAGGGGLAGDCRGRQRRK